MEEEDKNPQPFLDTNPVSRKISWDTSIEQNILRIGQKSQGYKNMHIQESRNMSSIYDRLMYSGILLGPIAGLLSGIQAVISPDDSDVYLPIAATCAGFISGIIIAITKYGKFEEKSSHHKIAASKYTSLESNVRRQLVLSRKDRINAVEYLEYIGQSFDGVFQSSPLVTSKVYEEYINNAKENGFTVPDESKITIHVDENVSPIDAENMDAENMDAENQSIDTDKPPIVKRSHTDLDKFSDGRMEYEMRRMMIAQ